ncbi:MMPL family transporter [Kitasatospora sp. NPDC008115]|uniref:MMPL family transporter n=1 Tax=Kitasatospora sp. NPDC008115 TaxID=3364022 RepID=UPI0036E0BD78
MLKRLGRVVTARPWSALLFVVVFLVNALVVGAGVTDRLHNGGTADPGSESARAAVLLERSFPASSPNLVLEVSAKAGGSVDAPETARDGARLGERLAFEPDVVGVTSYWQTGVEGLRSADRGTALILARIEGDENRAKEVFDRLAPRYRGSPAGLEQLDVRLGGTVAVREEMQTTIADDLARAELIALPITLLILVLVFRGLVAALLPLAVGICAILGTNAALRVITGFTEVSVFAQNLTTALGLGLAIDYALLIVRRFREERERGLEVRAAVATTLDTAGRAVLFSALTVAVSLSAMLVFPLYFLRSFAYAGISVVLIAAAAALILLPALLTLLGGRIDALTIRLPRRAARAGRPAGMGWHRTATLVMRRAPLFALGITALLLVAGLPFLRVQFAAADDRQLPTGSESRVVQQTIRDGFTASATGVIDVVVHSGASAATGGAGAAADPDRETLGRFAARLSALPGVTEVSTPLGDYRSGAASGESGPADSVRTADGLGHLSVVPAAGRGDVSQANQDLVGEIRRAGAEFPGLRPVVGGQAASLVDSKHAIAVRLLPAGALIVGATLLLVFLLTGSLLIPLQAVVLNALSLTAMFGVVVWVFQDGHLSGLLGFTPTGAVETTLPVLMFCVAFGLSMDYGVFLLSRVKEEYGRGRDPRKAVADGIRHTGGLITAAALILSVVLVAIGTSRITNTKMLGLGVALAVLVDATVVRCLLVPAVMALGGHATWWAPAPLKRFQERFGLREEPLAAPAGGGGTKEHPDAGPATPGDPGPDPDHGHDPDPDHGPGPVLAAKES